MLYRKTQTSSEQSYQQKSSQPNQYRSDQYGLSDQNSQSGFVPILLAFPSESLTHITSFLEPPSLLALSRVNRALFEHIKNDTVWYRAFLCQFLDISPENDPHDNNVKNRSLVLRRHESSWRSEFLARYNLIRRWERSRSPTVTHIPLHSPISSLHLMGGHQPPALLSSSLQYGIVSRSLPLTGKILRGYLDASGTGLGIGNNNPNVEFTPNVTACAMGSDGRTAKIIWGFRNGEVAVMTAQKAMTTEGGGRAGATAAKMTRCQVDDEHDGAVLDAAWDSANIFVTGGADGRVKLWESKTVKCMWTSEKREDFLVDPVVKVVSATIGKDIFIVAALRNGDLVLYTGLASTLSEGSPSPTWQVSETKVPCAALAGFPQTTTESHEVTALYISPASLAILAAYKSHHYFYRLRFSLSGAVTESTQCGDLSGPITAIVPSFSRKDEEEDFVITGDQLGTVRIYHWNSSLSHPHGLIHKFHAHVFPVTALAQSPNSVVIVTGSADGEVKVWDSLSFTPIRAFTFAAPSRNFGGGNVDGEVSHIIVEREVVVASAGGRVLAWKAGSVGISSGFGHSGKKKSASSAKSRKDRANAKYRQQLEIRRCVAELEPELEQEHTYVRRAYGREREQRSELDRLGLDEIEAVEYVLMLSRDEEENRGRNSGQVQEDGVFEGDFDDLPSPSSSSSSYRRKMASPFSSTGPSPSSSPPLSRSSLSPSNSKIQISPRTRPEPTVAGTSPSPLATSTVRTPVESEFPAIRTTTSTLPGNGTNQALSPGASPSGSVWGPPRQLASSSPGLASSLTSRNTSSDPLAHIYASGSGSGPSLLSVDLARHSETRKWTPTPNDGDEDLKFAIQLSLAEVKDCEEDV